MKFTAYEADGISPFVAHSPLMNWVYGFMSVRGFSAVLGVVEVAIALLIAARPYSPRASALGSALDARRGLEGERAKGASPLSCRVQVRLKAVVRQFEYGGRPVSAPYLV